MVNAKSLDLVDLWFNNNSTCIIGNPHFTKYHELRKDFKLKNGLFSHKVWNLYYNITEQSLWGKLFCIYPLMYKPDPYMSIYQ